MIVRVQFGPGFAAGYVDFVFPWAKLDNEHMRFAEHAAQAKDITKVEYRTSRQRKFTLVYLAAPTHEA